MNTLGLLALLVACGGSDDDNPFLGTWTYASGGTEVLDCDRDELDDTTVPVGSWALLAASDADVETEANAPCAAIKFDISDRVATAKSGQTCTDSEQGVTQTTAYTSYTLTLDAAGTTLTESMQGTYTAQGPIVVSCTLVRMATSTRP